MAQQGKINTLFLSYDGMTDSLGQSQVLPYLVGLSKHNYHITIISFEKDISSFTNNQNEIPATKMKIITATLPRIYQNKLGKSIPVYPNKYRRM